LDQTSENTTTREEGGGGEGREPCGPFSFSPFMLLRCLMVIENFQKDNNQSVFFSNPSPFLDENKVIN